jgi:hypothetical protein
MLGEPGMGKTTSLSADAQKLQNKHANERTFWFDLGKYAEASVVREDLFNNECLNSWKNGAFDLYLFLDSLDECQLRIETISESLLNKLSTYDVNRLYLRIICRTNTWNSVFEKRLEEIFGSVDVFLLTPLRRQDVGAVAKANGFDDSLFLSAVERTGVVSLAARPLTLNFLLRTYGRSDQLPSNQAELFLKGCRLLCAEHTEEREKHIRLSPTQLCAVAARIAAMSIFSGRMNITTDLQVDLAETGSVLKDGIVGGMEYVDQHDDIGFSVDKQAIDEVLQTALFSPYGSRLMSWTHRSYAEFLASLYATNFISIENRLKLVTQSDGLEQIIIPQLKDSAAWLASLDSKLLEQLAVLSTETLIQSEVAFNETSRQTLTKLLLLDYETREIISPDLYEHYKKLDHPYLSHQIAPYIKDKGKAETVRQIAVEIALACKLSSLALDLASVALDQSEPRSIRIWAAYTVANLNDKVAEAMLKPLTISDAPDDPDDELKGCALKALWPRHMDASELFALITEPKRPMLLGAYSSFLFYDLPQRLSPDDLPWALKWVGETQIWGSMQLEFENLKDKIMLKAFMHLDVAAVIPALAKTIVQCLSRFEQIVNEIDKSELQQILEDDEKRHALLCAILPLISPAKGRFEYDISFLVLTKDIPWIIRRLKSKHSEEMKLELSFLAAIAFDRQDPEQIGILLNAYQAKIVSPAVFDSYFKGVEIDSEQAERMKALHHTQLRPTDGNSEPPRLHPSPEERISIFLNRCERSDSLIWVNLVEAMTQKPFDRSIDVDLIVNIDLTTLPGWNSANGKTKARIVAAAEKFLHEQALDEASWQDLQHIQSRALAAGKAIALLLTQKPNAVDNPNAAHVWQKWAPALTAHAQFSDKQTILWRKIIELVYRYASETVAETLSKLIDNNHESSSVPLLDNFEQVWDERLSNMLVSKVMDSNGSEMAYRLLETLMKLDPSRARETTRSLIRAGIKSGASNPLEVAKAEKAASIIFVRTDDVCWPKIWSLMQHFPEVGDQVLLTLAKSDQIDNINLSSLNEKTLGDLYVWLVNKYPYEEYSQNGGWNSSKHLIELLKRAVLANLTRRGSRDAIEAINEINAKLPNVYPPKAALASALKTMRLQIWRPPEPKDIRLLARAPGIHLVKDESELLDLLIASLKDLDRQLHGEILAVKFLWNEGHDKTKKDRWRPKLEEDLSDWIGLYLDQNVARRGIIAQREVKIRTKRADIYVTAFRKYPWGETYDHIKVIIETKGCWRPELCTAMETQLAGKYLKGAEYAGGIYLVGWYDCEKWDCSDYKWRQARKHLLPDAQKHFDNQAAAISRSGPLVKAFVLNTGLD